MATALSGEFLVQRTPDDVYGLISDPARFAPLFPEYSSVVVQDPNRFTIMLKITTGGLTGDTPMMMERTESDSPQSVSYKGSFTVAASEIRIALAFEVAARMDATAVAWRSETDIRGMLAWIASAALEPHTRKNVEQLISNLQLALAS